MFTYDAVLAAALLTAPPLSLPASESASWSCRLHGPLVRLAVEMEILDPREACGIFQTPIDFAADLAMLQQRQLELINAPQIEETRRFPRASQARSFLSLNRALRQECAERLSFDRVHAEELTCALAEIDYLHGVWDAVREADSTCFYITVRRAALARLRTQVGMEAFYRGQLPPHVPLWMIPVGR